MLRRIALIALIAGGYAVAMYTSTGCNPSETIDIDIADLQGRVLNAVTSAPVVGASITATQGTQTITATSGGDGTYILIVSHGTVRLTATAPGFQPFSATVNVGAGDRTIFDIRLQPAT